MMSVYMCWQPQSHRIRPSTCVTITRASRSLATSADRWRGAGATRSALRACLRHAGFEKGDHQMGVPLCTGGVDHADHSRAGGCSIHGAPRGELERDGASDDAVTVAGETTRLSDPGFGVSLATVPLKC